MKRNHLVLCVVALMGLSCASAESKEKKIMQDWQVTGASILGPFKVQLQQALAEGMQGGAVTAVTICRHQARALAVAAAVPGVRVGRTSNRLRNPENRANVWQEAVLNRFLMDPGAAAPMTLRIDSDSIGYVEPIRMQSFCLACHGSAISADVQQQLIALYSEDGATGYTEGDLRGIFWIEMETRTVQLIQPQG